MITFLRGILAEKQPTRVVLDLNGVGYEILIPLSSYDRLPAANEPCTLLIHDHIREDIHMLFGFGTKAERNMFTQLLSVNGIGPKLALSALSGMTVHDLQSAILEADVKRLSGIQGVGKKMAERMTVELRDKITSADALEATAGRVLAEDDPATAHLCDAVAALTALGYSSDQARKMVEKALKSPKPPSSVEGLIKRALAGR